MGCCVWTRSTIYESDQDRASQQRAPGVLLLFCTCSLEQDLLFGLAVRAVPRVAEWWHTIFYLLLYVLIVIVDLCLLFSIHRKEQKSDFYF